MTFRDWLKVRFLLGYQAEKDTLDKDDPPKGDSGVPLNPNSGIRGRVRRKPSKPRPDIKPSPQGNR